MKLEEFLQQHSDSLEVCLRERAYGSSGRAEMIRDVMGLANLPTNGPRFIVLGALRNPEGEIFAPGIDARARIEIDLCATLVRKYLEPDLQIEVSMGCIGDKTVAVIRIDNCTDQPYMVSTELSQELKSGACWIREPGLFRAARRADLDRMFGLQSSPDTTPTKKPAPAPVSAPIPAPAPVTSQPVQLGFGDDPTKHSLHCKMPDVSSPPSVIAASRLQDQISVAKEVGESNVEDSMVARLVHVQQYGSESPYDERGISTLVENYNAVSSQFLDEDAYYYRETNALKLNFCVRNFTQSLLEDVSVVFTMPVAEEFNVVEQLCPKPGVPHSSHESDLLGYPRVKFFSQGAQVQQEVDILHPGEIRQLFETDLRIALSPDIAGKRIALRYTLHARGLTTPVEGKLRLTLQS